MGKTWVLDTDTKGTGARMVPLESIEHKGEPGTTKVWVPRKRAPRDPEPPKPRAPRRFRVIDVMTRRVLADDVDARTTLDVLGGVRRSVDVNVEVWEPKRDTWRLLRLDEQRELWRRRRVDGGHAAASSGRSSSA